MMKSSKISIFVSVFSLFLISCTAAVFGQSTTNVSQTAIPSTNVDILPTNNNFVNTTSGLNSTYNTGNSSTSLPSTSITPLQTSNGYYSKTTQFSSQSTGSQCGLSLNGNVVNQNLATSSLGYQVGITYNTAQCPDYIKLKTIEQEAETRRTKIYAQGNVVNNCVNQRALAVQRGQNPDIICKIPDLSTIDSILK
jgi:hypothetical protein